MPEGREQTLDGYVRSLPPSHRAVREYEYLLALKRYVEQVKDTFTAVEVIANEAERGRR